MSIHVPQNFYRQTITRAVTLTGATNIYVSSLPSPAEGYITISPANSTLREIIYYTAKGTDGNGSYLTVTLANRGLGGTTAQTHIIGEPVRMNVGAETIQEVSDAIDQIVAGGAQDASTTVKGISKLSVAPVSATAPIAVGDNDPRVLSRPASLVFGGTGADGALSITSGATNINLGSASIVVKNYTSISITGTGSLTFTNPHANGTTIILKSQGGVTLTSSAAPMIDASGLGAASATNGIGNWFNTAKGTDGNTSAGTGGVGTSNFRNFSDMVNLKNIPLFTGSGGGVSGSNAGGRGGGALYIECGGAWNFTTTSGISVAGKKGTNSADASSGGGGGGAGGSFLALYTTLTANSGTVTIAGGDGGNGTNAGGANPQPGTGGNGSTGGSGNGGNGIANGGADGASGGGGGSAFGSANGSNATQSGTSASATQAGGGGASGVSYVGSNINFA